MERWFRRDITALGMGAWMSLRGVDTVIVIRRWTGSKIIWQVKVEVIGASKVCKESRPRETYV